MLESQAMAEERIEDRLKAMIVERELVNARPQEIGDDDSLYEKWKLESVKILELVVGMEDLYDIEFEDEEFTKENFETVSRIAAVVRGKLEG